MQKRAVKREKGKILERGKGECIWSPGQEVALQGRGTFISSGVREWVQDPKGMMQWGHNFGLGNKVVLI